MNILFLMINFQDIRKGSPSLYSSLAKEFHENGYNVYVATILEKKHNEETRFENEGGLNVLRVKTGNMFNVNVIEKGITTITVANKLKTAIKKYFNNIKFDLIIYPTPPITFAPLANYMKKRDKAKTYLILRDIFPQNAKDLGIINNHVLFSYFRRKEKKLYEISDHIGCMSQGNIDYVLKHNEVTKEKLELLPNWAKVDNYKAVDAQKYKAKYGLSGKIIAVFGGNMGKPQELEFLLELASLYKDRDDIAFLLIGNGTEKQKLLNIAKEKGLKNVVIKDKIPRDDYESLVRSCDIGLINLNRNFTIPNIPSKTLSYFEAEIPVLASIDENTDYGKILDEEKAGLWSITGDLESYRKNFEKLLNNKELRKEMGKNGKKYLEKNLTVEQAYNTIIKHL